MNHFEPHIPWPPLVKEEQQPQQERKKYPIPIGPTDV